MVYKKSVDFNKSSKFIQNPSFAMPYSFRLTIDGQKYKNAMFSVQRVEIPDITAEGAPLNLPQRNLSISADKITYADLSVTFLIEEDFTNYIEIHDWIYGSVTQPDAPEIDKYKDISLLVLSSHNNVVREFRFIDAFPVNLSAVQFDATLTEAEYLTASAVFKYSYFKIT